MVMMMEPTFGMDKLSHEIFSILESKFLFGSDDPNLFLLTSPPQTVTPSSATALPPPRVRVLSIDAGGATDGLLAAASLARLESSLHLLTGDPSARVADFFDLAAGSGTGGVLAALLFTRGPNGRPILSAAEALLFLAKHRRHIAAGTNKRGFLRGLFGTKRAGGSPGIFRGLFGDLTLRDTVKPLLVPCYDLATGAPFVFSRADAMEADGYDFRMRDVCAATMGMGVVEMRSVDGRTVISAAAADGGVAMGNPAAAAITHVLNNKMEFPLVGGVEDVFLVSVGNGEAGGCLIRRPTSGSATPSAAGIVRIAGDGVSDMIDQAVGMAFGRSRATNYVRIQGREVKPVKSVKDSTELLVAAEEMLGQKNVESVLFQGKKLSEKTNAEKLEWACGEVVKEHERRKRSPLPVVVFKKGSPYCSSSSSSAISSSISSPY